MLRLEMSAEWRVDELLVPQMVQNMLRLAPLARLDSSIEKTLEPLAAILSNQLAGSEHLEELDQPMNREK
jgi:hypothetical protein